MTIFGPQLLLECVNNNIPLPKTSTPLLSTAMKGLTISFTKINCDLRESLKKKVQMMYGTVSGDLTEAVNVLVCGGIGTPKYRVAAQRKLSLMKVDWIDYLWESSENLDIIDTKQQLDTSKYQIGIFHGMHISISGLSREERQCIKEIIVQNGGVYCCDLIIGRCSHLILREASGQKYEYALKWKVTIVTPSWVTDSMEAGYVQDETNYTIVSERIIRGHTSTPRNSSSSGAARNSLESVSSAISLECINETRIISDTESSFNDSVFPQIFTGCVVSITNINDNKLKEQLLDILLNSGANVCRTKQEEITETLTHIITDKSYEEISNCDYDEVPLIKSDWILKSVEEKRCLEIKEFILERPDPKPEISPPQLITPTGTDSTDWDHLNQYFEEGGSEERVEKDSEKNNETIKTVVEEDTFIEGILNEHKYNLDRIDIEKRNELAKFIAENGGIVSEDGLIVTKDVEILSNNDDMDKFISLYYIEECIKSKEVLSVKDSIFYRPISRNCLNLFHGYVMAFSGFKSLERPLVKAICRAMGATVQDQMSHYAVPNRKLLATTHLIMCSKNELARKKILSAKRWGIPAVTVDWLNACSIDVSVKDTSEYQVKSSKHQLNTSIMSTASTMSAASTMLNDTKVSVNNKPEKKSQPNLPPIIDEFKTPKSVKMTNNNNNSTPVNINENELLTNLDTPIKQISTFGDVKLDMDNLKAMMKTPENRNKFAHIAIGKQEITTPGLSDALKATLDKITNVTIPNDHWMNTSLSDDIQSESKLLLFGTVIYASLSVGSQQTPLYDIVEKCGGKICWVYEKETVTHVICNKTSITPRNQAELVKAEKDKKILVSAQWLFDCQHQQQLIDTRNYLVNLNDSEVMVSKFASVKVKEEECENMGVDINDSHGKKRKMIDENPPVSKLRRSVHINWEYNEEDHEKTDQLNLLDTEEIEEMTIDTDRTMLEQQIVDNVNVLFSNLDKQQREEYRTNLEKLGVNVDVGDSFSTAITHLICLVPGRNEKYLAAVAAGKWILHVSFIEEVLKRGYWITDENEIEKYEMGGPNTGSLLEENNDDSRDASRSKRSKQTSELIQLAGAAHKWRKTGGAAFSDWNVLLLGAGDRGERLGNIISSGSGIVHFECNTSNIMTITHVLMSNKHPLLSKDKAILQDNLQNLTFYRIEILHFYLSAKSENEKRKILKKFLLSTTDMKKLIDHSNTGDEIHSNSSVKTRRKSRN